MKLFVLLMIVNGDVRGPIDTYESQSACITAMVFFKELAAEVHERVPSLKDVHVTYRCEANS